MKGSILALLCCLMVTACCGTHGEKGKPYAVKGVIDLSAWDFEKNGSIDLDGEWEFYSNSLLTPGDFSDAGSEKNRGYIKVPSMWKDCDLDGKGYGTYRLRIISSPDQAEKTVMLSCIYSAYRIWINGIKLEEKGMPDSQGKAEENYVFIHNKRIFKFRMPDGTNEIVLQVVNSDYKSGGIGRPLRLENSEVTARNKLIKHTVEMIIVGLMLFFAISNLLLYFYRRENKSALYTGLFSFLLAVNVFNLNILILSGPLSFPRNPYLVDFITVVILELLVILMIRSLFPEDLPVIAVRINQVIAAVFMVILIFAGFRTAEKLMSLFYFILIFYLLFSLYVFVKAIKNRRKDVFLFFAGFAPAIITAVNDGLYALWIIKTVNIFHYTLVIFCIISTAVVARRYSRELQRLSADLVEKNLALEKLDRIKDQFLANTSHELRTPLHGMIGLSESMLSGTAGQLTDRAKENLSLIISSSHRLADMVNDLLDMAKIQDESLALNLRPVDLYSLSGAIVKLSAPLAGNKPVKIINSISRNLPAAYADEDRIRQVLHNLVGNAVKFTNEGVVDVAAKVITRDDKYSNGDTVIEVSVSDSGIGIPAEYRDVIFEPYRQVDGSDTRSYGGTGLGLAIAKQIIELHNGTIGVSSAENGGSVFTFTLPVASDSPVSSVDEINIRSYDDVSAEGLSVHKTALPAGISDEVFSGKPVILVVDDDSLNIRVIQDFLEAKNCTVRSAADGMSALDIIKNDRSIDLVLLDVMMPVMSGYEVCRRIRASRSPEDLPVMMLTAKNMMSDIRAAFEAGANDYIVKPFQSAELLARVATMLRLRSVTRSAAKGLTIRLKKGTYHITFNEIIYITSNSKNVIIHTKRQDIELPIMMKDIEHRLPPDIFIRIHKSYIISTDYLSSVTHVQSGRYKVLLADEDDTELPVGRAFLEFLRQKIKK